MPNNKHLHTTAVESVQVATTLDVPCGYILASFPVPRPAFRRCLVRTKQRRKAGLGLGTRLGIYTLIELASSSGFIGSSAYGLL